MRSKQNTDNQKRREQVRVANVTYRNKLRGNGMFRFCMWIPKGIVEKVKKYIEELKKDE